MPPQPYTRSPGSILTGPGVMRERPQLAAMLADCIATGSEIEAALGNTLAALLGADAKPALAMYAALTGPAPQSAALRAAAAAVLDPDDLDLFESVTSVINTAMKDRHRFAHSCWAYAPENPDYLLVINVEDWRSLYQLLAELKKLPSGTKVPPSGVPRLDRSKILVYTKDDFGESLSRLEKARILVMQMLDYFREDDALQADNKFLRLSDEPLVKEALLRLRERRKNSP